MRRRRGAAAQYGFSEDQLCDPLKRDMCQTAALFAERDQARADVEREVGRIADELHVDSRTHAGRCLVFAELARRQHALATSRRFEPI